MSKYDFSGFDEAFKDLNPEEQEEANRAILKYLETVLFIAHETATGEEIKHPRTLAYSDLA